MFKRRDWIPTALPGSTLNGSIIAAIGALLGIGVTGAITGAVFGNDWRVPILMAPLAASSVVLFLVPASPLARPWSIVGGNVISALIGVMVAHVVANLTLAAALSVALSIMAMAATRSVHPAGGATALLAVIGGPAVSAAGFRFAVLPVGVDSLLLVALGTLFHRWASGHPYPHPAAKTSTNDRPAFEGFVAQSVDIDEAVAHFGEALDIDRDDVERLVREVERRALARRTAATVGGST